MRPANGKVAVWWKRWTTRLPQILRTFFENTSAKGARSSALHSLHVSTGVSFAGLMVAIYIDAPEWVVLFIATILAILFLVYIGTYLFLLFNDRDALRSESFTLSKMAIEKGLIGDDLTGLINATEKSQDLIEGEVSSGEGPNK